MYDAFVVALAVFIGVAGHEMFGMSMLSRPIVVAPLAGALMGDLQTGLIVGASLEAIFMGVVNIGISSTAEPSLAAGLATAFAIKMGGNVDAIIPIVFPLAVLGLQLMNMIFLLYVDRWLLNFSNLQNLVIKKESSICTSLCGLSTMRFMLLFHSLPFYLEQMLSKASWIIFQRSS